MKMVRPQAIPDHLRPDLERLILTEKQPQSAILNWLARQGIPCSERTLRVYCQKWGIARRGFISNSTVVSFIEREFHTTLHDDTTIARQLGDQGFPITVRQVTEIRLKKGWKHRTRDHKEREANWAETFDRVGEALAEGTVRSYGREMLHSAPNPVTERNAQL